MVKKNRVITCVLVFAMLLIGQPLLAIETASQILDVCAAKVNNSPSLEVGFTISSQGKSTQCSMIISKERYKMTAPDMVVWYDGTTQWVYQSSSKELNITEPFVEEMLESNPFAILNYHSQAYNSRRLSSKEQIVELVAKSQHSTVSKAEITIDSKTKLPSKLIVTLRNGNTFTIQVTTIKVGNKCNSSVFQYDKKNYPATEIIDLR